MQRFLVTAACAVLATGLLGASAHAAEATGFVFHDQNANGMRDNGEPGIAGVGVSNGIDVVATGEDGGYTLPVTGECELFVIKPADWQVPLQKDTNLPQFFYVHRPEGSPSLKHAGLAPTGPLPDSIDFPLYPDVVGAEYTMVLLGDTQPRNQEEVDYISHDIVEELAKEETPFVFGATMGDIVFDDLSVFEPLAKSMGLVGVPWYHVIGNHDCNRGIPEARQAYETYSRVFGPDYYSFNYGDVHYIALNSIRWNTAQDEYHGGLGEEQLKFIENDLALVPKDKRIVLMMHIPILDWDQDVDTLFALLKEFPHNLALSAHWHRQQHNFFTEKEGWQGAEPLHHVVHATACGSWWGGWRDEMGIPHGNMADGAPNGHSFITFDGNKYSMRFKAPRREASYQMDITAPEVITPAEAANTEVVVNLFAGSSRSSVEMRLGEEGDWLPMAQFTGLAPHASRMYASQAELLKFIGQLLDKEELDERDMRMIQGRIQPILGRGLPEPRDTDHLWKATLPVNPPVGYHFIHVRTTDMFGQTWTDRRVIRVEETK
jgi:hypothetical protein